MIERPEVSRSPLRRGIRAALGRGSRLRWVVLPTVLAVAAGAGAWAAYARNGPDTVTGTNTRARPAVQSPTPGTPAPQPDPWRIIVRIPVGDRPVGLTSAHGGIWVANHGGGSVSRIDPIANRVVATIRVGPRPLQVASGFGSVWVTDDAARRIWRIDPLTNSSSSILLPGRVAGTPAVGAGSVWVTILDPPTLVRIDPGRSAAAVVTRLEAQPLGLSFAQELLWVAGPSGANDGKGKLAKIDPATGMLVDALIVDVVPVYHLVTEDGAIWVADALDGVIARIDPLGRAVAKARVGSIPVLYLGGDRVWVNLSRGRLVAIDRITNALREVIRGAGGSPGRVTEGYGSVWATDYHSATVSRIDLLDGLPG